MGLCTWAMCCFGVLAAAAVKAKITLVKIKFFFLRTNQQCFPDLIPRAL